LTQGTRQFVNSVQLFQELYRIGLNEEEILDKIVQAKSAPGKVIEVNEYKFRYDQETTKYEDNRVSKMITRVMEGEDPEQVVRGSIQQGEETHEENNEEVL